MIINKFFIIQSTPLLFQIFFFQLASSDYDFIMVPVKHPTIPLNELDDFAKIITISDYQSYLGEENWKIYPCYIYFAIEYEIFVNKFNIKMKIIADDLSKNFENESKGIANRAQNYVKQIISLMKIYPYKLGELFQNYNYDDAMELMTQTSISINFLDVLLIELFKKLRQKAYIDAHKIEGDYKEIRKTAKLTGKEIVDKVITCIVRRGDD